MRRLYDVVAAPSAFDSYANYMGERPDKNLLCVLTRNRDSDCLTESNWAIALKRLGGESDNVKIFHFGHWSCGWWKALAVVENTNEHHIAEHLDKRLSDYPVLDDDDFSEREQKEADEIWKNCYMVKDRIEYIRKHRIEFEFYKMSDMLACIRGEYFAGYASELVS